MHLRCLQHGMGPRLKQETAAHPCPIASDLALHRSQHRILNRNPAPLRRLVARYSHFLEGKLTPRPHIHPTAGRRLVPPHFTAH